MAIGVGLKKALNRFVNRAFFATLRFAVTSPLCRKTPLHKKMPATKVLTPEITLLLFPRSAW